MLILTLSSHEILFVVHETINILLYAGCHSEKGSQYGNCETETGQPCQINSGGFYWNAECRLCWSILQYAVESGEELPDDILQVNKHYIKLCVCYACPCTNCYV